MTEVKKTQPKRKSTPKPSVVKVEIVKGHRQSSYHIGQVVEVSDKEADILINKWKIAKKVNE